MNITITIDSKYLEYAVQALKDIHDPESAAEIQAIMNEALKPLDFTPEYADLITRVCEIDTAAADYLSSREIRILGGFTQSDDLDAVMYWSSTPQGQDYWIDIDRKLRGWK